jgi:DNA-binding MarR family transcriptional regulator
LMKKQLRKRRTCWLRLWLLKLTQRIVPMTNQRKPKYIRVWWDTLIDYNLKPTDLLLAYLINRYCDNKNKSCYASKEAMAKTLNVSRDAIYDSLKKLEHRGIIIRYRGSVNNRRTAPIMMSDEWDDYYEKIRNWELYNY